MKVRLLVLVVGVLIAILLLQWSLAGERQPSNDARPTPVGAERPAPAAAAAERQEVAAPAPGDASVPKEDKGEEPFDPLPVQVTPFLARFLVVDQDEQPIADAVVTIWAARKTRQDPRMAKMMGGKGNAYSGREAEPLLELRTDVLGRTQATLQLEGLMAAARKEGLGSTAEEPLWHTRAADKETKFVIEPPVALRGIVLRSDGQPAAGARVVATVNGSGSGHPPAPTPDPVTAGADGRFELKVRTHGGYDLQGELDGKRTFAEWLWIYPDRAKEVVLRFPGGITLAGVVIDQAGKPVAKAGISAWREFRADDPQQDTDDMERVFGNAGEDGRFSIAVRRHARYQLVAKPSEGGNSNSRATWVETTPVRPHAEVRLELPAFASIKGRVLHGSGSPFAGVRVGARPEAVALKGGSAVPGLEDLFGRVKAATTESDGGFVLSVHPAITWTVQAWPVAGNNRLSFEQTGIAPGRDDVELRIGDTELKGCTVRGTVTRADGQAVGLYRVDIVDFADGKPASSGLGKAKIEGSSFTLPPLSLGRQLGLRVSAKDNEAEQAMNTGPLAPAQVGPFVTDRAELSFEFRLEAWGKVSVRVLDAAGTAARKVRVAAVRDVPLGHWPSAMPVDAAGTIVLERCVPGAHHLQVWAEKDKLLDQELLITPGLNPEVVVRLAGTNGR